MSELLDAAAALGLAAFLFLLGMAAGSESGFVLGLAGALSAGYVGARVGTLRRRVSDLETRLDDDT